MSHILRNYKIVEEKMISQTDLSLGYGQELIDSELNAGAFNFVVKPIVKAFYKLWSDNNARVGTLKQIKIALDSAKTLVENGEITKEKFDEVINKNFQNYLENDQTDKQCKKDHKDYEKLKEITKKAFISQVEECALFLNIKEDVKNYDELSRAAFKTKEKAYEALKRQLDFNENGIAIVEQDDTILNVPAGKNIIVSVLRKGFELTKQKLIEELDIIFYQV
ncbi:unnamed protein product [marine sediment metagenome]|uniref:Uncharacterized protein n=1 Tax=marine sediment metagenome TaxID=412755 RepID=X1GC24_9ZZZZ